MFGFKIIKMSKYLKMNVMLVRLEAKNNALKDQLEASKQNSKELYDEYRNASELAGRLERELAESEARKLKDYFILKSESYKCDECRFGRKGCKKLIFANQTVCVCEKDKVKSFNPKRL